MYDTIRPDAPMTNRETITQNTVIKRNGGDCCTALL